MRMYVHRRTDGSIASAHQEKQPEYAVEELGDDNAELIAFLNPPALAPDSVSNFQGRTALRMTGIFDAVSAAINALPDKTQRAIAQDAFDRADFDRDSDLLNQILVALGHDEAFRNDLFRQAAAIKV